VVRASLCSLAALAISRVGFAGWVHPRMSASAVFCYDDPASLRCVAHRPYRAVDYAAAGSFVAATL